jgi:hypothetical protein
VELSKTHSRLVLVDGDPVLGMDAIKVMKDGWNSAADGSLRWVEECPPDRKNPSDFLNHLDGEVSVSDWGGEHKIVFLRGLINSAVFKEGLLRIMSSVAVGNTLLIFDEGGVIRSDAKAKSPTGWDSVKEYVLKFGVIADVPRPFIDIDKVPWGERVGHGHVKAVVEAMAKRGKKISAQTVRNVFFERVELDWSFIIGELDKLADLVPGETISPKDVISIVYPTAPKHAIFELSMALNSGDFQKTMDVYDDLVASKIVPEVIFASCMKVARWQLIASHLYSYGQPLPSSLESIGSLMNRERANSETSHERLVNSKLFKGPSKKAENKDDAKDEGVSSFVSKGVSSFVKDVFSLKVPVRNGKLGSLTFMQAAMTRYLTMMACMEEYRECGDKEQARPLFRQAMLKICWRGE